MNRSRNAEALGAARAGAVADSRFARCLAPGARRVAWLVAAHLACAAPAGAGAGSAQPTPADDYTLNCAACHAADGRGTPGVVPSLRGLAPLLETRAGRDYLVRVPGVAQAPLDDARLAAVLNWVMQTWAGVAPDPPFAPDEVARLRRAPLRDPRSARP